MALSGDHRQYVFLDSARRNRKDYPLTSEFVSVIGNSPSQPLDPVADGGIIFSDIVGAGGYLPLADPPGRVELTSGIETKMFENEFIDQYVEVIDISGLTPVTIATSRVAGYSNIGGGPGVFANWIYVQTPLTGALPGHTIVVRQLSQRPYMRYISAAVAAPTTSLTIAGGSLKSDEYKGMFLKVVGDSTDYNIRAYDGVTKIATIYPALAANILIGTLVEIYRQRENCPGLAGNGAMGTRTSPTNHEIQLEFIRIPRQPIFVHNLTDPSIVKTINDFGYLIVQFRNTSDVSSGVIQSNNPVAGKGQFIVPVEDISTGVGKFFTLRSPCAITIKFNPQEPIHFGVYLPNGNPLKFDPDDYNTGSIQPNIDLQIMAMFGIKRILG